MHANKIKTAIPSRTRNKKLQDLRQQQRNLQKTNQRYFVPYRNYNTNKRNYGNRVE